MVQLSVFVTHFKPSNKLPLITSQWPTYHILESNPQRVGPEAPLGLEQTPHAQGLEPDHAAQAQLCKNNRDHQPDKADQEQFAADGRSASNKADDSCADDDASNDCTGYRKRDRERGMRDD